MLADGFAAADPAQSVACDGWTATELLAHVVAQERLAGFPLLVATPVVAALPPRLRDNVRAVVLDRSSHQLAESASYRHMIDSLRRPPPPVFKLPGLVLMRIVEMWVHHEDLRRPTTATPRSQDDLTRTQLWSAVRLLCRRVSLPPNLCLTLAAGYDHELKIRSGRPGLASIHGEPGELLLYLTGRRVQAHAEVSGDPGAVALLNEGWRLL